MLCKLKLEMIHEFSVRGFVEVLTPPAHASFDKLFWKNFSGNELDDARVVDG